MEFHYNGTGDAVNGRGLRHRKMSRSEAARLAADIASGRPFMPSIKQAAALTGAPIQLVTEVLKTRAALPEKAGEPEVVIPDLSSESSALSEPSALTYAWYAASSEERENFLREEIVPRVIR
jgi:hypothetical protein